MGEGTKKNHIKVPLKKTVAIYIAIRDPPEIRQRYAVRDNNRQLHVQGTGS